MGCGAAVANFDTDFSSLADYASGGAGHELEAPAFDIDYRNLKDVPRILDYIKTHGKNPRKPLKQFNVYMIGQTDRTFKDGGRGDVHWKPLAPITLIMRAYRKRGRKRTDPKRILQDSGIMKNATNEEVIQHGDSLASRIFNDVPYAKTHQFGGSINIPARTIRPKKAGGVLHFVVNGEDVFTRKVFQPAKTKPVPARPFLFFLQKDRDRAVEILLDFCRDIGEGAMRERPA